MGLKCRHCGKRLYKVFVSSYFYFAHTSTNLPYCYGTATGMYGTKMGEPLTETEIVQQTLSRYGIS